MKVVFASALAFAQGAPTFQEWAAEYGFNGDDTAMEATYNANVAGFAELEAAHPEATFGVNQFTGMTFEEFSAQYLTATPPQETDLPLLEEDIDLESLASDVDWSVTPVKDQGSCGSCWAFGTLGQVEAAHKQKTGQTVSLAEQQLVDCSKQNNGCSGGRPDWALTYLAGKSIYTTSSYPYRARDGSCSSGTASGVTVSGYSRVSKSDSALASALNQGAVTVLVYADSAFQSYRSGILTATTTCNLNHAVLATGYGSNFWKIKNSWGSSWGESGYIRFSRTTSGCGSYGMFYDYPTTATGVNMADSVEV
jgi:C1A family cysteine protease